MFFDASEMNHIIESYECPTCTVILDCPVCRKKYTLPRILPCGNVVCSGCVVSVTKSLNKHYQFKCSLCDEIHDLPKKGFPICKQFQSMLTPHDTCQNTTADTLKKHLKDVKKKIRDLNNMLETGKDKLIEHCLSVRNEVKLATKAAFQFIKEMSDSMINQVNKYEKECVEALERNQFDDGDYVKLIGEMRYFADEWSAYFDNVSRMKNYELTDGQLELAVEIAINLKKKSDVVERRHDEYLFNKKIVKFEKNYVKIKKDFLGEKSW